MKTLRQMILLYSNQDTIVKEWDSNLRLLRFVYNNMMHQTTGFTPFELVYGRTARTITNTIKDENTPELYRGQAHTPQSKFAKDLKEKLDKAFEIVYENLTQNVQGQFDNQLEVNDEVLLFNTTNTTKYKPRKLQVDWLGPMQVINHKVIKH
jgi:hypothetical protein